MASLSIPFRVARPNTAVGSSVRVLAVVSAGFLLARWAMNPVSGIFPTLTSHLQIDGTPAGWLMNAYFVVLVSLVLIAGRAGDAFGHGRVFRTGCLVFGLGSLIAALSSDFNLLLGARAVQGLGSAMLFGTSLAIIATVFSG